VGPRRDALLSSLVAPERALSKRESASRSSPSRPKSSWSPRSTSSRGTIARAIAPLLRDMHGWAPRALLDR
jgi:hypothetical protein